MSYYTTADTTDYLLLVERKVSHQFIIQNYIIKTMFLLFRKTFYMKTSKNKINLHLENSIVILLNYNKLNG